MNPGGMENNDGTACMAGINIHRLPYPRQDTNRPEANAAWEGSSEKWHVAAHVATDYEPPAWLAVDAPAMAVDGEQVWFWMLWLTLTGLTFAVMFKALVWFGGMP